MDNQLGKTSLLEGDIQDKLARRAVEGLFLLTLALATYLLIALFSYDRNDPAWSSVTDVQQVQNAAGTSGAWIADVLFSLVGYVAFIFPLILIYRAWLFFRVREQLEDIEWAGIFIALIGILLVVLSLCGLASINSPPALSNLPFGNGGMLGEMLGLEFLKTFGLVGGRLIFFTLFFTGITIFTDVSWMALIEWVGANVVQGLARATGRDNFDLSSSNHTDVELEAEPPVVMPAVVDEFAEEYSEEESSEPSFLQGLLHKWRRLSPANGLRDDDVLVEHSNLRALDDFDLQDEKPTVDPVLYDDDDIFGDRRITPRLGLDDGFDLDEPSFIPATKQPEQPIQRFEARVTASFSEVDSPVIPPWQPQEPKLDIQEPVFAPAPAASKPAVQAAPVVVKKEPVKTSSVELTGELPEISLLLKAPTSQKMGYSAETLERLSRLLEMKLLDFKIDAKVTDVFPGPVVTRFEIQPAPGIKVSSISNLAKDIARSLAVVSVRVVEVIAGKTVIGIEIPNEDRKIVYFSEVIGSPVYEESKSPLTLALGHDISGQPVIADLAKMPHLLVAGTTGSGKSVGVNAMLLSLLFKSTPKDVRLILVDPKMLELSVYDGIPHLLTPVITDMKDAANGLRWCVGEMERRYKLLAKLGVRNIAGYNKKILDAREAGEVILDPLWKPEENFVAGYDVAPAPPLDTLPYIVVVIDEFADMIMVVGKKVEELIARIAQKARAAGIHLILATQRPSVDVITGLIKANVPTRIAFQVSSKIDSRTILDQGGAEQLLGHGDMLYMPPGTSILTRVHGAFVDDDEVHRVVASWKERGEPDYIENLLDEGGSSAIPGIPGEPGEDGDPESDALYDEAVAFVIETRKASISAVQRKLRIGYNRAARMIETMEAAGIVSTMGHNGQREVLVPPSSSHR